MSKLIVIGESLEHPLPQWAVATQRKRFMAKLEGDLPVTVLEFDVPDNRTRELIWAVSESLRPERYYAHVLEHDRILVAFRNCIFCISRGDAETAALCRAVGGMLGIPEKEMQFERMFEVDHPDLPEDGVNG